MKDLIERQAAIDALKEHRALYCDNTPVSFSKLSYAEKSRVDELDTAIATLVNLPSAQPEQRNGEWIDEGFYADGHGAHAFRCSECGGHIIEYDADPFCRWCGANMKGEQDE